MAIEKNRRKPTNNEPDIIKRELLAALTVPDICGNCCSAPCIMPGAISPSLNVMTANSAATTSIGHGAVDERRNSEADHKTADGRASAMSRYAKGNSGICKGWQRHVDREAGKRSHQAE